MNPDTNASEGIQIFVSYARDADREWVEENSDWSLIPWLKEPLARKGASVWWDTKLNATPGTRYTDQILDRIHHSRIAILLISTEFLSRPFINEVELPAIKRRVEEGTMLLVPIVVNDVVWNLTEFGKWLLNLQLIPSQPAIPVRDYCKQKPVAWPTLRNQILASVIRYVEDAAKLPPPAAKTTFTLTVNGGSGSGCYATDTAVKISAGPAPVGRIFDRWTGANIVNPTSANTTLAMPAADAVVSATYRPVGIAPPSRTRRARFVAIAVSAGVVGIAALATLSLFKRHAAQQNSPIETSNSSASKNSLKKTNIPSDNAAASAIAQDKGSVTQSKALQDTEPKSLVTELRVTDSKNAVLVLRNASISYPSGFGPGRETSGIRVKQGVAEFTLAWAKVDKLTFTTIKQKKKEGQIEKEIYAYKVDAKLTEGDAISVELVEDWNMAYMGGGGAGLLFGQTAVGEVKIRFCDIKTIETLKRANEEMAGNAVVVTNRTTSEQMNPLRPITFPPIPPPPSTTNFAEKVEAAKKWLADMPKDADLNARVRKALDSTTVGLVNAGLGSFQIVDKNSGQMWRSLNDANKGSEVPYLCLILMESAEGASGTALQSDWKTPWKVHAFLKYSFRAQDGKRYATNAFPIVAAFSTFGGRWTHRSALETITEAPVLLSLKWEGLQYAMERCSSEYLGAMVPPFVQFGRVERREDTRNVLLKHLDTANADSARAVLEKLPEVTSTGERSATTSILLDHLTTAQDDAVDAYANAVARITPPEEHDRTAARLLDVLERVQTGNGGPTIGRILKDWNYRESIPRLKKILETSDASKCTWLTRLLADWKDKDSAKDVRAVIERFRYGDASYYVSQMMTDLYTLEGADCATYLAEVLLSASASAQQTFLSNYGGALRTIRDKPVADAIRQLAESSTDANVKKLAAECLK